MKRMQPQPPPKKGTNKKKKWYTDTEMDSIRFDQSFRKFNEYAARHQKSPEAIKKDNDAYKLKQIYPATGAIEMTSNPIEWFIGTGGIKATTAFAKGGFNLAKTGFNLVKGAITNQVKKPSNMKKAVNYSGKVGSRAATDLIGDKFGF